MGFHRKPEDVLVARSEPTERVMLMIAWTDLFAFITMIVTVAIYIDSKHKK